MYLILKRDFIHLYLDKSKTGILGRREYKIDANIGLAWASNSKPFILGTVGLKLGCTRTLNSLLEKKTSSLFHPEQRLTVDMHS